MMASLYAGIGIEEIIDDFEVALMASLNDNIPVVNDLLEPRDQARAERRGIEYVALVVEPIEPQNFHQLSIPSFVEDGGKKSAYPLLAIVPGQFGQDAESPRQDHFDVLNQFVTVHVFAKANPSEGPDIGGRRAIRLIECVYRVVNKSDELRRRLRQHGELTSGRVSEPWLFPPEDGAGEDWYWQAAYAEFRIKNNAVSL